MPLPHALAEFNLRVTNRFTARVAGRLPGFAIVVHRGRRSGREYRTPVNAFRRTSGGYSVALTYGPRAEWVRNVLAAGGCTLETEGRRLTMTNPRIIKDPTRRPVPAPVRLVLSLLDVDAFLLLDRAPAQGATSHPPLTDQ